MKYLILGNTGQLGSEFEKKFIEEGISFTAYDLPEIDIRNHQQIFKIIDNDRPNIIINCTAYNSVDKAETEIDLAYEINAIAPHKISEYIADKNILLVHYSSDYVFDGKSSIKYTEKDQTKPINIYGKSKLKGEELISTTMADFLIFRLSWLYSKEGKQNFVNKIINLSKNNNTLSIVTDEISIPTHTSFVVEYTLLAIKRNIRGLYNLVPNGLEINRYDFADLFLNTILHKQINLISINQNDLYNPARRPIFSAMDSSLIQKKLSLEFLDWLRYLEI